MQTYDSAPPRIGKSRAGAAPKPKKAKKAAPRTGIIKRTRSK